MPDAAARVSGDEGSRDHDGASGESVPSLFNEVLGPIMVGPSSSHTAGPARIGLTLSKALPDDPKRIKISFDREGSFASTYQAQGSNYGFVGGLLGMGPDDEELGRSIKIAEAKGVEVLFEIASLSRACHPNFAQIEVETISGFHLSAEAASTGGGAFEITSFQGQPIRVAGAAFELVFDIGALEPVKAALRAYEEAAEGHGGGVMERIGQRLVVGPVAAQLSVDAWPRNLAEALLKAAGPGAAHFPPVLPQVKRIHPRVPFGSAAEAISKARGRPAWALAVEYETGLCGGDYQSVIAFADKIRTVMRRSALRGLSGDYKPRGFLPPQSPRLSASIGAGAPQLGLGLLNEAAAWALGVMDYDISLGMVVAAPTAGSSGVIPGAVICVGEALGRSDEEVNRALLTAGLVGILIARGGTFAAEMAGCQAEVGAASAMAAGALVDLLGGDVETAFKAAALALQNTLGLICDPVCGVGNVPCVSRNASGAANAMVSANMALAGFDPFIPLDEVVAAMKDVGLMLPPQLRCTGGGGLCQTPTAKRALTDLNLDPGV